MCASLNTTAALLECPVCCCTFLVQSPALTDRAVCTHCGAHQLMRPDAAQGPAPRAIAEPCEAVVLNMPAAIRNRSRLARR